MSDQDDDNPYRPQTGPTRPGEGGIVRDPQLESAATAEDDDLGQSMAIQGAAEDADGAAGDLPTVPSPARRTARRSLIKPSDRVPSDADAEPDPSPSQPATSWRARRKARRAARAKAPWWELPALVVVAVVVAILIKSFLVQPFYIPSESMEHTLHGCTGCSGDRVLVNKPIFHIRDPHPGDIIVFPEPAAWPDAEDTAASSAPSNPVVRVVRGFGQLVGVVPPDEKDLIKRVVAVGGQTVQCCDSNGNVQVADSPTGPFRSLNEPYIYRDPANNDNYVSTDKPTGKPVGSDLRTFGPVTVPKGRLWVMGDHRNDSADSSFHWHNTPGPDDIVGDTVPVDSVIGKAVLIAWPPSRWRTLGTPATFEAASALGTSAPVTGAALAVLPVFGIRRRRRRRPR